ncbi:MAG TPA: hypothetical protein PK559_01430 [Ignavibacteriaceae bacterium]|nr:hypothetical protein [Ignavibacteriaceae bacterium]
MKFYLIPNKAIFYSACFFSFFSFAKKRTGYRKNRVVDEYSYTKLQSCHGVVLDRRENRPIEDS